MAYRYSINNIIRDIDRKLHSGGTSLTQDFYGALDEGRRMMVQNIQPIEMQRSAFIENALYDQVDKYAVPTDLAYDDVIEIKALSDTRNVDTLEHPLEQVYTRRFDQKRHHAKNIFAVSYDNGVKYMKIYHPRGLKKCQHLVINEANSLTENGTWNTGGNLVNLQLDQLDYISGRASLRFDFNNSGTTGFIENFTQESVDIYDYFPTGSVFTWVDIPVFKIITSIKITLGSSLTDTYEFTVNQPHDNNQFIDGWNLLKFSLDGMISTGNPNPKAITYVRFDFTTTGESMAATHLDNVIARKGMVYEVTYQSPYCFIDPETLVWKQFGSSNTDFIVLEEDAYQVLMWATAYVICDEAFGMGHGNVKADLDRAKENLALALAMYKKNHKSEILEPYQTTYVFGDMYSGYTDDSLDDNDMYPNNG